MSVVGDFNGDGKRDLVLMAENTQNGEVGFVAWVSYKNRSYTEYVIWTYEWDSFVRRGLSFVRPGTYETACSKGYGSRHDPCPVKFVTIENEAFRIFTYESGSTMYYWKEGRFHKVWVSD